MAKTSMVEKEKRRARTVKKYAVKRAQLKTILQSVTATEEERWVANPGRTKAFDKREFDLGYAFTLVAMLLISPLGWIYYFPLLLLPFVYLWYGSAATRYANTFKILLAIALFLSSSPQDYMRPWQITSPAIIWLWSGCYLYALLMLAGMLLKMKKIVAQQPTFISEIEPWATLPARYCALLYGAALLPSFIGIARTLTEL